MTSKARLQLAIVVSVVAIIAALVWPLVGARDNETHDSAGSQSSPRAPAESSRAPTASRDVTESRTRSDSRGSSVAEGLDVPPEARETLSAILRGGPFRYRQDGAVFQNREGHLPAQPRGYYREYTVETPGSRDRGPRRIVAGGDPPTEFFYTSDHYRSFRRIEVPR